MKRDYLKHLGFTYKTSPTMSRMAYCAACAAAEHGVKSRIALEHTCGLQPSEWPVSKPRKTWKERLAEEQAKQGQDPILNKTALELVAEKYATAHALLEKFISRHEAGLLPDRLLYNEIKTFLDGTR